MLRSDFIKRIKITNKSLGIFGLCFALSEGFPEYEDGKHFAKVNELLRYYFDDTDGRVHWAGAYNEYNTERRRVILRLFEQIVLTDELYEEF